MRNLILLISALINILIFNYIYKLEKSKCNCSSDWKRKYIKYYSLITIFICIILIGNIIPNMASSQLQLLSHIYFVFGLVNVYALFKFSQKLVIEKCECSDSWERIYVYFYSMVIMSLYIFLSVFLLFNTLFHKELKKLSRRINK